MFARISLAAGLACILSLTVACVPTSSTLIHPGEHLDRVDHTTVGDICHGHLETSASDSAGHHCHDLRSEKEPNRAFY